MDLQPTLTGEFLLLRPLRSDEFEALYAAASDPLVWEQHPENTRYQRDVFQRFFDEAILSKGALAIVDKFTGEVIGSSRYYDFDAAKSEVVIGYTFMTRKYWGGKYNAELKRLMLGHAFKSVQNALFHVGDTNIRSQKAMEKVGGVIDEKKFKLLPGGKRVDYFIYRIKKTPSGAH